mgnify:FL=1
MNCPHTGVPGIPDEQPGAGPGRDSGSPVSPDYSAPFAFTGGTIDRVVIDVSGEHYVDHEKEVAAWIMRD